MTESRFKQLALRAFLAIACLLFWVGLINYAVGATVNWTKQEGTYHWYKAGTINKYPPTNPIEFDIPASWIKQTNTIYIHCKSTGGSNRYYPQGYDCNTGKPAVVKCEAYQCQDDFGYTFDLTKNTVMTCPMVKITKEQIAMSYDGLQANGKCR